MELVPFVQWPLNSKLQESLAELGFVMPTQVQQDCWEDLSAGRDLLVQSCTGTGKTLAFALPLLNDRLNDRPGSVLVVLPTRELAMQVAKVIASLGTKTALLYGGGSYNEQIRSLKAGAPVVVGTPGRLIDHLERGTLDLSCCRALVLDEADEMLDMGFAEELGKILDALPESRQSLLFSATMPSEMEELASKTLRECKRISVSIGLAAASDIKHEAYEVAKPQRAKALVNLLYVEDPKLSIIFCHTKAETDELTQTLISSGLDVLSLHGDMAQAERTRTLNSFRSGNYKYLIATDVAARGLDVQGVTHVINMAVPQNTETYIHRVGRTGRAGKTGKAITFASGREVPRFKRLLSSAHIKPEFCTLPQSEDVRRRLREQFHKSISEISSQKIDDKFRLLASELLSYLSPAEALASVLTMLPKASAIFDAGNEVSVPARRKDSSAEKNKLVKKISEKAAGAAAEGMSFIQINLGKSDGMTPSSIIKLLGDSADVAKTEVGEIDLRSHTSFVEIPSDEAAYVLEILNHYDFGMARLRARLITPEKMKVMIPKESSRPKRSESKGKKEGRKRGGQDFGRNKREKKHGHSDFVKHKESGRDFEKGRRKKPERRNEGFGRNKKVSVSRGHRPSVKKNH